MPRLGAERDHAGDRRLDDAAERAAPAGMRGADHPGDRIDKQDRGAIGRQDAERHAGGAADHAVGRGRVLAAPGLVDADDDGAVNLPAGDQPVGRQIEPVHRDGAVARNILHRVAAIRNRN